MDTGEPLDQSSRYGAGEAVVVNLTVLTPESQFYDHLQLLVARSKTNTVLSGKKQR